MKEFIKWKIQQLHLYSEGIKRKQRIKSLFGKHVIDLFDDAKRSNDQNEIIELEFNKYHLFVRTNSTDVCLVDSVLIGKLIDGQWRGEYYQALDYLSSIGKDAPIIIDGGANIGIFSVACLNKKPNCKIIAIEPENRNFELLKRNIGYNCNLIKGGIWSHSCKLELIDRKTGDWGFMVRETDRNDEDIIEAVSIHDIIMKFNLPQIDLLKLDIEGSEYEIFSNDYNVWLPYINAIVIETHDNIVDGCDETVTKVLLNEGFFLYATYEENKLFVRKTLNITNLQIEL